jgi:hypothetical protein
MGEWVKVRTYEDKIEVWYADKEQLSCERLRGRNLHRIDYRHVIWSLVRKPDGFTRHVYREELFPSLVFRFALVQRLLSAKRDLRLEKELAALDRFDAVILDDIGYVQQSREEMAVLFTFLAARYERRSVIITSNVVFSEWDRIFKDPMTTAAAIDRLVHHAVILEMTGTSIRAEAAEQARKEAATTTATATTTGTETKTSTKEVDGEIQLSPGE